MKLIHHVKKHWKTITLHLKKHHKKYIFGILSATLLRKWVSLIATYALVHNLSFSFADTVHQWNSDDNWTVIEETIVDNEQEDWAQEGWQWIILKWTWWEEWEEWEEIEWEEWEEIGWENWNWNEWENWNWNEWENWDLNEWESLTINGAESNWICDSWDIVITSPVGWGTVWWIFDITREFTNNDCSDTEYTIKLRSQSGQLEIYSWNSESTWFSFDSTQLESNYYTLYNLTIYGNDTIYRDTEWGDFTIDNKAPELSDINVNFSTNNKKLNIWDTITISFESDEELINTTVNVLWKSALLEDKDWNKYTYTIDFSEENTEWKVVYWIEYSDILGNTGYYEWYEDIELDYTEPEISNLEMLYNSGNEIKVKFNTNENTNAHIVYLLSWLVQTESLDSNDKTGHEFILKNIRNKYYYNYNISIEDDAKNEINIWWNFQISWNRIIFTNKEINKSELITEIGFKTWDEQEIMKELKNQINNFDTCSKDITFKKLNLPIKWTTWRVEIPEYDDSNINKLTNAFTIVLVERLKWKELSQDVIDEIFEDLNKFLIVVKLVKDDNNTCKQNMSQYYINRFKKALIKYNLINN